MCSADIFLGMIAVLFPPIAVWVKRGLCSADSLINIALCCFGYIPGLIHAWYIIAVTPEYEYHVIQDGERGQSGAVTYYYIQPPRGYGTVNSNPASAPPTNAASSSSQAPPAQNSTEVPPPYSEIVKGDNKVQGP